MSHKLYDHTLKLLMLGDTCVGKSSLVLRFTDDDYNPNFLPTLGIDYKTKTVGIGDKPVKLQVWDTAGQERFKTITTAYYRTANGVILVYDITREDSFRNINNWMEHLETNTQNLDQKIFKIF